MTREKKIESQHSIVAAQYIGHCRLPQNLLCLVLRCSAEDSAIIYTTPPLGGEVGDAQTKNAAFFFRLDLPSV